MNIEEILQIIKFGYTGDTIDLIYLFGFLFLFTLLLYKLYKLIQKGDLKNE